MSIVEIPPHVAVHPPLAERYPDVLDRDALEFLGHLHARFAPRRQELLALRAERAQALANGEKLDFLQETRAVREDSTWKVAAAAPGLIDRRVEITGPPQPKMGINALNSGAKVWMADLEDATSPTWENVFGGQEVLQQIVAGELAFTTPEGKHYSVGENPATLVVRPRGWHLEQRGMCFEGKRASASLVDFGLYFFHCAKAQIDRGQGPYFYLPKLQSHLEARLWNDIFVYAQDYLDIPQGTIRATVLIETLPAAFQMEEILYELRDHAAGLNAGRWDYIFSLIKTYPNDPEFVLGDRASVTMTVPFMRAYTELLVKTCHKRGAHSIGGMAAFIPSSNPEVNEVALAKVRDDKRREAGDGFDGSWVAHPGLVQTCREEFDAVLGERPNQKQRQRDDVNVTAEKLQGVPGSRVPVTRAGLTGNVAVALRYIEAWLRGNGAVAIFNLMEDAATAEISRSQLWQWIRHGVLLSDGNPVTATLVKEVIDHEYRGFAAEVEQNPNNRAEQACALLRELVFAPELVEFLTVDAYAQLSGGSNC